jgi:hypothetical protein
MILVPILLGKGGMVVRMVDHPGNSVMGLICPFHDKNLLKGR